MTGVLKGGKAVYGKFARKDTFHYVHPAAPNIHQYSQCSINSREFDISQNLIGSLIPYTKAQLHTVMYV